MPQTDFLTELLKQGGLAVGMACVLWLGVKLLGLLKAALDREQARNDQMREDLKDLTTGIDRIASAVEAMTQKLDALLMERRR